MNVEIDAHAALAAKRIAYTCSLIVMAIGLYVLFSLVLGHPVNTLYGGRNVIFKFNMGLGLALVGFALWLTIARTRHKRLLLGMIAFAFSIGFLTLLQYVLPVDFGIDQLFWRDTYTTNAVPGRMMPMAALALTVTGLALLLLQQNRTVAYAQAFSVVGFWTSFFALVILYFVQGSGATLPSAIVSTPVSSAAFLVMSCGILTARAEIKPMRIFLAKDAGGFIVRTLFLAALLLPLITGALMQQGQLWGLFDSNAGESLHITSMSIGLLIILWVCALALSQIDAKRRDSESQLKRANDELEDRVSERTATLEQIVDMLTAENTQRQTIEATLAQERNLLRTLIDTLPDYIFIKDTERRFILSNEAHAHAVGKTPDAMIGEQARWSFPPELATQFEADDLTVLRDGHSLINVERQTLDAEGNLTNVLTSKVPLRDEAGAIIGLIGISRDIRDRKEAEAKQRQLELERSRVAWLQELVRNMSHDHRTPLTIMRSSLHLLQKTGDPAKRQDYVARIETEIANLEQSGENLEILTRLEMGSSSLRLSACDTSALTQEVCSLLENAIKDKSLSLVMQLDEALPPVLADHIELKRAIRHVLQNAISYTPAGGSITVVTRQDREMMVLAITDTGIGIAAHELPHVFTPFYRADQARGVETGNSGLGLTIVKKVMDVLGGEVKITSEVGKGTEVTLLLPVIPPVMRETMAQRMFA